LTTVLITIGLITALLAVAGSIVPVIPGPPLGFAALLLVSFAKNWEPFGTGFLITTGVLAVLIEVLDYVLPAEGARRYGASKFGVVGAILGMAAGFITMPPLGIVLGALAGAVAGELAASKGGREALRAGWGVFLGFVVVTVIRLAFTLAMLFFCVKALF
jgi:uncharacterized protein